MLGHPKPPPPFLHYVGILIPSSCMIPSDITILQYLTLLLFYKSFSLIYASISFLVLPYNVWNLSCHLNCAHHRMRVYISYVSTPLLTHHALPQPLHPNCVFVLRSDKGCEDPNQLQETPLHESPEWVCVSGGIRLQKWHVLKRHFWGNRKCPCCRL